MRLYHQHGIEHGDQNTDQCVRTYKDIEMVGINVSTSSQMQFFIKATLNNFKKNNGMSIEHKILTGSDNKEKGNGALSLAPVKHDDKRVETHSNEERRHEDKTHNVVDGVVVGRDRLEHLFGVIVPGKAHVVGVVPKQDHLEICS